MKVTIYGWSTNHPDCRSHGSSQASRSWPVGVYYEGPLLALHPPVVVQQVGLAGAVPAMAGVEHPQLVLVFNQHHVLPPACRAASGWTRPMAMTDLARHGRRRRPTRLPCRRSSRRAPPGSCCGLLTVRHSTSGEPLFYGSLSVQRRLPSCVTLRREALIRIGDDPNLAPKVLSRPRILINRAQARTSSSETWTTSLETCPVSRDLVHPHLADLRRTRLAETPSRGPSHLTGSGCWPDRCSG
jgi:hypothetical protein